MLWKFFLFFFFWSSPAVAKAVDNKYINTSSYISGREVNKIIKSRQPWPMPTASSANLQNAPPLTFTLCFYPNFIPTDDDDDVLYFLYLLSTAFATAGLDQKKKKDKSSTASKPKEK